MKKWRSYLGLSGLLAINAKIIAKKPIGHNKNVHTKRVAGSSQLTGSEEKFLPSKEKN